MAASNPGLRARPALAAAAVQVVLAYALLSGLAAGFGPPPPAIPPITSLPARMLTEQPPPPEAGERAREAPAPPAPRSEPAPRVAPTPAILIVPTPQPAATVAGQGVAPVSGAAAAGSGSGAGGIGSGTGGGGTGDGGAGGARAARRISGALRDSDYPEWAARQRAEGTVLIAFTVTADGRVRGCRPTRSSGHAELDDLTCRLVEARFRYRPALDAAGRAVASTVNTSFTWAPRG